MKHAPETMSNVYDYIRKHLILLLLTVSVSMSAQIRQNQAYLSYIERYKAIAVQQMQKYKIPASITLAQGLLESGGGRSDLAVRGNNHFGIKCHDWTGPSMRRDDDAPDECFRVYDSAEKSFEDHSLFLLRKRYSPLFSLKITDYRAWANGLKSCGYATSPTYAQSLISIIETYRLYEYDTAKVYTKPATKYAKGHQSRPMYMNNGNYYVIARRGETYKTIANEFDANYKKLAKYNERDKNDVLEEGEIVYLLKKKKHAAKEFKHTVYTVKAGDSMYSIAQRYGMRVKSLYDINRLPADYSPRVGDRLSLY